MSEMFTKCNGFIVSGDPLVYADSATMTGQGTVSEPFGVKSTDLFVQEPLYTGVSGNSAYIGWRPDETVLYSSTGVFNTDIQLSESLSGFDYLRVDYALTLNSSPSQYAYNSVSRIIPTTNIMLCKQLYINDMFPDGTAVGKIVIRNVDYTINNDGTKLNYMNNFQVYFNGTTWNTGSTNVPIYKIVGIGRKV